MVPFLYAMSFMTTWMLAPDPATKPETVTDGIFAYAQVVNAGTTPLQVSYPQHSVSILCFVQGTEITGVGDSAPNWSSKFATIGNTYLTLGFAQGTMTVPANSTGERAWDLKITTSAEGWDATGYLVNAENAEQRRKRDYTDYVGGPYNHFVPRRK
ncbi:hypothetical protein EON81_23705 [bacterium]|nr:MAG: hypothetical protein EON81_23705 [bacterium]